MRLENKKAIITGGARGIGESVSRLFASEGASVLIADMLDEEAEKLANDIVKNGGKAAPCKVNVTDKDSVKSMVDACTENFGGVDILINNAGVNRDALAMRMKEEQWDLVIDVNLKGSFLCAQAVIKPMMKTGGRIINTSSVGAMGNMGQANYSASKGGVISLTRTLAIEWSRYKVNVNCVAPGATMTSMYETVPEERRAEFEKAIPLGRLGDPSDIAKAHLFFCSSDADYITGQTLFVDGGLSLGM